MEVGVTGVGVGIGVGVGVGVNVGIGVGSGTGVFNADIAISSKAFATASATIFSKSGVAIDSGVAGTGSELGFACALASTIINALASAVASISASDILSPQAIPITTNTMPNSNTTVFLMLKYMLLVYLK